MDFHVCRRFSCFELSAGVPSSVCHQAWVCGNFFHFFCKTVMNRNYQKELDKLILSLSERPKLLLHACCGPCCTYAAESLREFFDITIFYFNPNTHPEAEYRKRLEALKKLAEHFSLPLLEGDYEPQEFFSRVKGMEQLPEGGERCAECFRIRLEETAKKAKEFGFDFFCSTLSVSPHKNASLINEIGETLAEKYGVPHLPNDFKKKNGFFRSTELSKELGLYRQDYCGCVFSKPGAADAVISHGNR